MKYASEFSRHWRQLTAASVGMAFGYTLNNYLANVFIPPLMQEFDWQRSHVALIGLPAILSFVFQPLAGRITDRLGVRTVALFGVIVSPLLYLLLSAIRGSFVEFFLINLLQIALVTSTTGAVVYSRLIAQNFNLARGMALAICACAPSVAGAFASPLLTAYITREGWRAGYVAVAGITLAAGLLAVMLIPKEETKRSAPRTLVDGKSNYAMIIRNPAFKILFFGMALCSISVTVQSTQLKLIVESLGVSSARASWMISLYATGVIVGRLVCGAALDRFPPHWIAAFSLGLPGIGLLILAAGTTSTPALAIAVLLLGLSLGTELDLAGYIIMRFFELSVYSTVLGIIIGVIALSGAFGSLVLSASLNFADSYTTFLLVSAVSAFVGGSLFLGLRHIPPRSEVH